MPIIPLPEFRESGGLEWGRHEIIVSAELPPYVDDHIGVDISRIKRASKIGVLGDFTVTSVQGPDREYQIGGGSMNADGSYSGSAVSHKRLEPSDVHLDRGDWHGMDLITDVSLTLYKQELEQRAKDARPSGNYEDPKLWARMINRTVNKQTALALLNRRIFTRDAAVDTALDLYFVARNAIPLYLASDKAPHIHDTVVELGVRGLLIGGITGLAGLFVGRGLDAFRFRPFFTQIDRTAAMAGYLSARPIFRLLK